MGLIISPAQAGLLVGRQERIIRGWIASGQLPAHKNAAGQWEVNTDDLLLAPHVDATHQAIIRAWVDAGGTSGTHTNVEDD